MPGQFTRKKMKLRSRAQKRRFNLKIDAPSFGVVESQEQANLKVIRSLEEKVQAAEEQR